MNEIIWQEWADKVQESNSVNSPAIWLNRSFWSMYVEWWCHNVGYWITLPFVKVNSLCSQINERCKHVDLEEW